MQICFQLSMPNVASWNGRWSGEGEIYAKIVKFSKSKINKEKVERILSNRSYYHRWDDGWGASVSVREVDGKEAAKIRKYSKGFYGYEWMIDNIISHGSCYDKKVENDV